MKAVKICLSIATFLWATCFCFPSCDSGDGNGKKCTGNWDPAQECAVCKGNWDPEQDCAVCKKHWVDDGDDCRTCPLYWDSGQECNACIGNWDPGNNCSTCRSHWDVEYGCARCESGWVGTDCEKAVDCVGRPDFTICEIVTAPNYWYDICVDDVCISPGSCGNAACNVPGPHFELPDTNQRGCYDSVGEIECPGTPGSQSCSTTEFCGQDAQYGWDTKNEMSERFSRIVLFVDQPVVSDNVTGLMWQGCIAGKHGRKCYEGPILRGTWLNALVYCDSLIWGGYDDWYLPDRYELQSMVDYQLSSPSINLVTFPNSDESNWFYSSSSYYWSGEFWGVGFIPGGDVSMLGTGGGYNIRCVRREKSSLVAEMRFDRTESIIDQPIVKDNLTDIVWQGCSGGQMGSMCTDGVYNVYTWQDALSYCEGLAWGGDTDWYLPNAKELASIVDDRREDIAVDPVAFPETLGMYWSSTTNVYLKDRAWTVAFDLPYVIYNSKDSEVPVRCARREE